jgi:hypothetical protein
MLNLCDVMEFEWQIMSKFVSRGQSSAVTGMSFFFSAPIAHGNEVYDYVRCLEHGQFVGLARTLFAPDSIYDVIMTHDDAQSIMDMGIKYRPKDVRNVMQSWNALCESFMKGRSGKYGSVENDVRFGFVFSENSETKVLCHNLECDDIADEAQKAGFISVKQFNLANH